MDADGRVVARAPSAIASPRVDRTIRRDATRARVRSTRRDARRGVARGERAIVAT
jgi:hypothetical protein